MAFTQMWTGMHTTLYLLATCLLCSIAEAWTYDRGNWYVIAKVVQDQLSPVHNMSQGHVTRCDTTVATIITVRDVHVQ